MVLGALLVFFSATRKSTVHHIEPHRDIFGHAMTTKLMLGGENLIQTEQVSVLEKQKDVLEKSKILLSQFGNTSDSMPQIIASK